MNTKRNKHVVSIFNGLNAMKRNLVEHVGQVNTSGLPPSQWVVLYLVHGQPGMGVKDIAEMIGITSSAATQLVNGLSKKGLVVRKTNTKDRRALQLYLSPKAKKQIETMMQAHVQRIGEMFSILTTKELVQYDKLTQKIIDQFH